jgi:hypothetical protein
MRTQPELRNVEFAVRRQTLDAVQRPVVDVLLASWHLVVPGVEFVLSDQMMNWLTESRDQIPSQAHACTCVILQLDIKVSSSEAATGAMYHARAVVTCGCTCRGTVQERHNRPAG